MGDIAILTAMVLGLTEIGKRMGIPTKFSALVALALGVGFNIGFKFIGADLGELIIGGLIAGLTASGLYSGTKAGFKK